MYESLILNEQFPPNDDEIKQLTHYARVKAGNKLEGLAPTRELFPPIRADVKPPRLSLWKHTKEGKDHVRRSRNIGNGNIVNSGRVVGSDIRQASLATNQLVGMVEVDTGLETITFKFTSTSNGSKDNLFEVNLNVNMMDLLRKVQRWRDYERSTHDERIFIVSKDESSLVSTFDLERDFPHISIKKQKKTQTHQTNKFGVTHNIYKITILLLVNIQARYGREGRG